MRVTIMTNIAAATPTAADTHERCCGKICRTTQPTMDDRNWPPAPGTAALLVQIPSQLTCTVGDGPKNGCAFVALPPTSPGQAPGRSAACCLHLPQ